MTRQILTALALICSQVLVARARSSGIPRLAKHGSATQLVVDGRPFLMLGAELLNSSSSSLDYMRPI